MNSAEVRSLATAQLLGRGCDLLPCRGGPVHHQVSAQVQHRVKDPKDTNALAVVDRKIQQIKTAIAARQIDTNDTDWKTILPDIVRGLNDAPSDALQGQAPNAIDASAEFDLQKANAARAEQSQQKQLDQKKQIAATGTVRMRLTRREEEELKQSAQKAGQLGPRRRKFLATYQGGTKQALRDVGAT